MNEYKREKINLEARLQQIEKQIVDHDDHIRIIDAWLLQVSASSIGSHATETTALTTIQFLQEIELLVNGSISSTTSSGTTGPRVPGRPPALILTKY